MPSFRVNDDVISLSVYDVIGLDGARDGFIGHVGIARESGDDINRDSVPIHHMKPPLQAEAEMEAHAVGSADLTEDESQKIKLFVNVHALEDETPKRMGAHGFVQAYCILPHAVEHREDDGRYPRMRFSCVGFVYEAYKAAKILLVGLESLPDLDLDSIKAGYSDPVQTRMLENTKARKRLGLEGEGPWPVMLCGYLFHALGRDGDEVRANPYEVQNGDELFS